MGKDRGDERRWHYRDPDTMRLGCDQGERDTNSGATSIPEHVTCGACLLHWRVMGRARAIEALKATVPSSVRALERLLSENEKLKNMHQRTDAQKGACEGSAAAEYAQERIAASMQRAVGGDGYARDVQWLNQRGENPASLRALVEAVDAAEKKLVGDAPPHPSGRAVFVKNLALLGERMNKLGALGEDEASLLALVEAVDAAYEKHHDYGKRPLDSRVKYVNSMSAELWEVNSIEDTCEGCGDKEALTRRICGDCYPPDSDPDESANEDVPLGGMSHEDAHRVLAGIEGAASMLDHGQAWPDDARRAACYLRRLLK